MIFPQAIKDQSIIIVSRFVGASAIGFFWFYLASIMDKEEYGELGYLISIANIGFAISLIGLNKLIIVFGAKNENVVHPAYSLGLITSSLVAFITYLIIYDIAVSLLIFGLMIFSLTISEQNSLKKFKLNSLYNILQRASGAILGVVLFPLFGIAGIIFGLFLGNLFGITGLITYFKPKNFYLSSLKPKKHFMLSNYFVNLFTFLFWWGDKILIQYFYGFENLASYILSVQVLMFLSVFPASLFVYFLPNDSQRIKNPKLRKYSIIFSILFVILVISLSPTIINQFLPNYSESILFIQIMSMAIVPLTISTLMESKFLSLDKSKYVLIGTGVQTISYFVLIASLHYLDLGIFGVSIGFLIAITVKTIYYFLKSGNSLY